jgi:hypothetical protein
LEKLEALEAPRAPIFTLKFGKMGCQKILKKFFLAWQILLKDNLVR